MLRRFENQKTLVEQPRRPVQPIQTVEQAVQDEPTGGSWRTSRGSNLDSPCYWYLFYRVTGYFSLYLVGQTGQGISFRHGSTWNDNGMTFAKCKWYVCEWFPRPHGLVTIYCKYARFGGISRVRFHRADLPIICGMIPSVTWDDYKCARFGGISRVRFHRAVLPIILLIWLLEWFPRPQRRQVRRCWSGYIYACRYNGNRHDHVKSVTIGVLRLASNHQVQYSRSPIWRRCTRTAHDTKNKTER